MNKNTPALTALRNRLARRSKTKFKSKSKANCKCSIRKTKTNGSGIQNEMSNLRLRRNISMKLQQTNHGQNRKELSISDRLGR